MSEAEVYATTVENYARQIGISESMIEKAIRPLCVELYQGRSKGLDLPCMSTSLTETTSYHEKMQKLLNLLNNDLAKLHLTTRSFASRREIEPALEVQNPFVTRNVRSTLANDIQEYWVGRTNSNIGVQYLTFKDGIIRLNGCLLERTDIMVVQFFGVANVFVEADGSKSIDVWSDGKLTKQRRDQIYAIVDAHYAMASEYVAREARFLKERPWLKVDGMTPEQAVAKLTELGWGPTPKEEN